MQKQSKQSRVSIRKFLCVSILIIGISIFSSMIVSSTTVSYDPPTFSSLTPHDPISITSDSGLEVFPGTGTAEDPYLIDGYNITTTSDEGISIIDTTKFFTISSCYIDAVDCGIYIRNAASGTATVINNTCSKNNIGINLYTSSSSTVTNNTCNNNHWSGIRLWTSGSSTVFNNTCSNNGNEGILLVSSGSSTVANNTCSRCNYAIWLLMSSSSTVINNTCSKSTYGINLTDSDFCVVTCNLIQANGGYGIWIYSDCNDNLIHHNSFVHNKPGGTSQCLDDGIDNQWYDTATLEGNFWSDWSGLGSYSIDGSAGSIDLYPLDEPEDIYPPFIVNIFHSPSEPTELDTISINASVIDSSGLQSVTLHYRINSGTWIDISMTLVSGDLYSVSIGSYAVGDTIEYYGSAIDNSVNNNEEIEDNGGLYYVLTVITSDVAAPIITDVIHTPSMPTELDTINITAIVTDYSGLWYVTLYYRVNGGTWQNTGMTLLSNDIYSAIIGTFAVGDTIEYAIYAVDNSVNHIPANNDNSGLYYSFTVVEVIPEFQMLSLLLPAITSLFLSFSLVVLQRRKK